tara:strand:- start:151 stop:417 length:267 start_codon:yes stop_codon:yes gene_type:complete
MFKGMSLAEFKEDNGQRALLFVDNGLSVDGLLSILNKVNYYCMDKKKEAENAEAQRIKDEEAERPPELEEAPVEKAEVVVEEAQPVEA